MIIKVYIKYQINCKRPARQIPELAHNSGILEVLFTFPQNGKRSFAQYFVAYFIKNVAGVLNTSGRGGIKYLR